MAIRILRICSTPGGSGKCSDYNSTPQTLLPLQPLEASEDEGRWLRPILGTSAGNLVPNYALGSSTVPNQLPIVSIYTKY